MEQNPQTIKLFSLCDSLPVCCSPFLLETGTQMSLNTRLAYARELVWFFDYLISHNPLFCDMNREDFQLSHIKQIVSQDISDYILLHKDKGLADRTIARKRAALSSFFNYLTYNRQIEYNPVLASAKVPVHTSNTMAHLDLEEQIDFLAAVENGTGLVSRQVTFHERYRLRDIALITLLLDTGMRVSELNGLNIEDLDLESCSAVVTRKGGSLQNIYFSDDTGDTLRKYIKEKQQKTPHLEKSAPLFTTLAGKRLSVRAIENLIKKYAVASIPDKGSQITPNQMRTSYAMTWYAETKDLLTLQKKLGHKSLSSTNVYAKASEETMRETRSLLAEKRRETKQ